MEKIIKMFFLSLVVSSSIFAEPTCPRCEIIREQNKHRTDCYEYYDDYKKDHPKEAAEQQPNAETPVN